MFKSALMVLVAVACAVPAMADFNFQYPRTRLFSDVGRGDVQYAPTERRSTRRSPGSRQFSSDEAYDATKLRFGGFGRWNYQYRWRDYLIADSGSVFGAEAYAAFMGFEASVFMVADSADKLNVGNPIATEYRGSYTLKLANSLNTVALTFQDWSTSARAIANTRFVAEKQGFGSGAPPFEDSSTEISVSSYWFQEAFQTYSANLYVGLDAWGWLEGPGLRMMGSIGALANSQEANYGINGARVQAGIVFQSDYHRAGSSFPGSNFLLEIYRDLREDGIPMMIVGIVEYYLPFEPEPMDAITFGLRVEVAF